MFMASLPDQPIPRHARPCAGHPRRLPCQRSKTWMAGTSPAMTTRAIVTLLVWHCHRKQHHFKGGLNVKGGLYFKGELGLFLIAICAPSRSSSWASDL